MTRTDATDDERPSVPDHLQSDLLGALEAVTHGISLLDADGEFVYVDDTYAEIYGYDPSAMLGMHWEALYPDGMSDEVYEDVLPAVEADGTWRGETVGLRRDGSRLIEDHYLARTEDGRLLCVVRDVTDQRRRDRELDRLHDRITDAVIGTDADFSVTHLDDRAREVFGVPDGTVPDSLWDVVPDEAGLHDALRRALEERAAITTREYVPSLDAWLSVRAYGSETGLSVYLQDVSSEQRYRERLEHRERALRRVYEVISDRDRPFEQQVDALLEICQSVVGTRYATFSRVEGSEYHFEIVRSPDDTVESGDVVSLAETNCERAYTSGDTLVIEDVDRDAPDLASRASNRDLGIRSYLGTPVDRDGDVYGTFCFYDTEPREEAFSDWEVTFVDLLGRWVGYELERERRREELEASNERLEQFAHALSHDLGEPVRTVSTYATLLDRRYGDDLDADAREYLEIVAGSATRMTELIDGLLQYSRVDSGGEEFQRVDLDAVVSDATADLGTKIDERGAEIEVADLPTVSGDEQQLRQLFQNLLDNAIEYSPGTPHVAVTVRDCGDAWELSVSDDGIGIDPADADRVFGAFERVPTDDAHEGSGLGLALCERIVERHGGEIWVDTEAASGTTISFTLPAAEAA